MTSALLSIFLSLSLGAAKVPDGEGDEDFYGYFPSAVIRCFQCICKTAALGVMHQMLSMS